MNTLEYIKTHKLMVGLAVSAFVVIVLVILIKQAESRVTSNLPVVSPTPTPQEAKGDWGSVSDFVTKLGNPINLPDNNEKEGVYKYQSKNINQPDEVQYNANVPTFYKQIITSKDNKTAKSIISKYGNEEIVLYGNLSDMGVNLYAYPSKGIAYVGSKTQGVLFEVWYFAPTDVQTFVKTWAKDYTSAPTGGGF